MTLVMDAALEIWRGFWPFLLAALILGAAAGWLSAEPERRESERP